MTVSAEYNLEELNKRIEAKAFQFTYYLSISAIFLWLVWLVFDYYKAEEIFLELLIARICLSLGAISVTILMRKKLINSKTAQFLLYIPALSFLGFLYNYTPDELLFTYIFSGIFMVIVAGFVFFIMPLKSAVFFGLYSFVIIFLFQAIYQKHTIMEILLNGGVLFMSMTAFTVAYTAVRYKSLVNGFINEILVESTNKKLAEQQEILQLKNNELEKSLEEKEVLLKEIHHRVKNNLQIISSLLTLQDVEKSGKTISDVLISSQSRIHAMSVLHTILYKSNNLAKISVRDYINMLVDYLGETFSVKSKGIIISMNISDVHLVVDKLIPLGLVINEIVSNSLKHAFPNNEGGNITLEYFKEDDTCVMIVSDNGIGLPDDFSIKKSNSLGFRLIFGLSNQLNGDAKIQNTEKGTSFKIKFNDCLK
ncbi:MAG: sensor histidine kinase [Bacteroidetes bacterium]|nr:sensor histidine kinase [Bacteroidota bacterium]